MLEKDGYALRVDEMRGSLLLSKGDDEVLRLFLHGEQVHEEVTVDFNARTMTFLDPDTNQAFVTFTFDEIEQAQQEQYENMGMGNEQQAFLSSPDGSEWSVQDLDDILGDDQSITVLYVTADRVIAAVSQDSNVMTGPPPAPEVQMWFAPIP